MGKLEGIQYTETMSVSTEEVTETISKLKKGKSCGPDGICAEALKVLIAKCMYCYHCVFPYACLMVIYLSL